MIYRVTDSLGRSRDTDQIFWITMTSPLWNRVERRRARNWTDECDRFIEILSSCFRLSHQHVTRVWVCQPGMTHGTERPLNVELCSEFHTFLSSKKNSLHNYTYSTTSLVTTHMGGRVFMSPPTHYSSSTWLTVSRVDFRSPLRTVMSLCTLVVVSPTLSYNFASTVILCHEGSNTPTSTKHLGLR